MSRREKMFAVLPTLLTLGNAACGFGSITFAAKVGPEPWEGNHLLIAAILIFLAMIFDMLDGSAARWANQTSDFGAELDSLCDAVSCGVAPAFLMLKFSPEAFHGRLLWVIAALYVVCALLRLARFNVETGEEDSHEFFSGLPSPAAAGTVASFPIATYGLMRLTVPGAEANLSEFATWLLPIFEKSLPLVTLGVGCLMVTRIRYIHVFTHLLHGHATRQRVIQLIFTVAVVYIMRDTAVPLILPFVFCFYAFAAPVRSLRREVARRWRKKTQQT